MSELDAKKAVPCCNPTMMLVSIMRSSRRAIVRIQASRCAFIALVRDTRPARLPATIMLCVTQATRKKPSAEKSMAVRCRESNMRGEHIMSRCRSRKRDAGQVCGGTISTYSLPNPFRVRADKRLILLNPSCFHAWLPCGCRHALAIFAVAKDAPKSYPAIMRVGKNGEKAVRADF